MASKQSSKVDHAEKTSWGSGGLFGNRALGSLFLVLVCPAFVITSWYTCSVLDGSIVKLAVAIQQLLTEAYDKKSLMVLFETWYANWPTPFDPVAWKIILSYMAFELVLMRFVPGKKFLATVSQWLLPMSFIYFLVSFLYIGYSIGPCPRV